MSASIWLRFGAEFSRRLATLRTLFLRLFGIVDADTKNGKAKKKNDTFAERSKNSFASTFRYTNFRRCFSFSTLPKRPSLRINCYRRYLLFVSFVLLMIFPLGLLVRWNICNPKLWFFAFTRETLIKRLNFYSSFGVFTESVFDTEIDSIAFLEACSSSHSGYQYGTSKPLRKCKTWRVNFYSELKAKLKFQIPFFTEEIENRK